MLLKYLRPIIGLSLRCMIFNAEKIEKERKKKEKRNGNETITKIKTRRASVNTARITKRV